ncbi:thioredoxin family protein [Coraliomargarita algicola]|uniref:Thioredoxin family protein n=1 Tax=Coraliomargarita algicola TaxID=3092156 RepID=A0ABZ0RPY8_9BACT|nr:thioredoxin family protein [Coraliomargarita sp. J2-16]WPJ97587.1 thioredoxin family protein [Coraliomargarita sp. J2-16]
MRKILITALFTLLGLQASLSAGEGWMTDFDAAKAKAVAENKPLLVDFTGSDWCGWCIKLDKEVFSQAAFKQYAEDALVLVELDFPRSKPQSAELKAQNEALAKKYGIRGFPTILVLSPEGKLIEKTGYRRGGAEQYVEHIQEIVASAQ